MSAPREKPNAPQATSRGGSIKRIGDKKYRVTWHQGRGKPNIRRTIRGTWEMANRVLGELRARYYANQFGWPQQLGTPLTALTALVVEDYRNNDYSSLKSAQQMEAFWNRLAGTRPADSITGDQLTTWATQWRAEGLSPARVNRRMSFLLRAYRLGLEKKPPLASALPKWTSLEEGAPRSGTWTWDNFVRVRSLLPPHSRIPVTIEYWLGTREGETLLLEWKQIRFHPKEQLVEIKLNALDTKTKEERRAFLGGDLYETLFGWYKRTRETVPDCPWVCHRNGRRLTTIKTSWRTAVVKAGLGTFLNPTARYVGQRRYRGPLIHDFRRTAVSNMEDAGIPRKVAMAISGHKTDSVYRRYHIVRTKDLIEAGRRLMAHHEQAQGVLPGEHLVNTSASSWTRKEP